MPSIADRLFEGDQAKSEFELILDKGGIEYESMSWDWYDSSLELDDVDDSARISEELQKEIHDAGFQKVILNHKNKWETHYQLGAAVGFSASPGWRVSYPNNRGEQGGSILVEEYVDSWPKEWFESGHARVVSSES